MTRTHTHPCDHCRTPVACDGQWEANHDGWPAAICGLYHAANGGRYDCLCEDCREKARNYDGPDDGEAWAGGFAENH